DREPCRRWTRRHVPDAHLRYVEPGAARRGPGLRPDRGGGRAVARGAARHPPRGQDRGGRRDRRLGRGCEGCSGECVIDGKPDYFSRQVALTTAKHPRTRIPRKDMIERTVAYDIVVASLGEVFAQAGTPAP